MESAPTQQEKQAELTATIDARLFVLEREARIAAFHQAEAGRERSILLAIAQVAAALVAALYAAIAAGWLPADVLASGSRLNAVALAALAAILAFSSMRSFLHLRAGDRKPGASGRSIELAE